MHDLLMDFIFDLSEGQQALIMFGSMVLMIVLAVPIPIAVAIGTAIGYFMMDLNLVQVVLSMYTGVEPFPLVTVPLFVSICPLESNLSPSTVSDVVSWPFVSSLLVILPRSIPVPLILPLSSKLDTLGVVGI